MSEKDIIAKTGLTLSELKRSEICHCGKSDKNTYSPYLNDDEIFYGIFLLAFQSTIGFSMFNNTYAFNRKSYA
jgi:hypothetical protein